MPRNPDLVRVEFQVTKEEHAAALSLCEAMCALPLAKFALRAFVEKIERESK